MTLSDFLKSAQEKLDKATPGKWTEEAESGEFWIGDGKGKEIVRTDNAFDGDVQLISSAPETIGKLLRMVEAAKKFLDALSDGHVTCDCIFCRNIEDLEKIAEEK